MDSVLDRLGGLSIADRRGEAHSSTSRNQSALEEASRRVAEAAATTVQRCQTVDASTAPVYRSNAVDICELHRDAQRLARSSADLAKATERAIVDRIIGLGKPPYAGPIPAILRHFDGEIMAIARGVLDAKDDAACAMWHIAEECYNEATRCSGKIHLDNYFIPLEEACPGYFYDTDSESEESYEGYTETWRQREARREEDLRRIRRRWVKRWVEFWARVLGRCPGGPTLFWPPAFAAPLTQRPFADPPRYLFRAFDAESSGENNDSIVASTLSISAPENEVPCDILQLRRADAASMLYHHLTKYCFDGVEGDNLMSWSSSLLFVIQYAIWRSSQRNRAPSEIWICAVDTSKFPAGQFARDMHLIEAYTSRDSDLGEAQRGFFDFRLGNPTYDNGEYLSQGRVYHGGRSCTFSLQDLVQAGLHDLYPEFSDARGGEKWTNRVCELRTLWSIEQGTSQEEVEHALRMAKGCLGRFDMADMAMLLLAFKNRKLGTPAPKKGLTRAKASGPDETLRYRDLATILDQRQHAQRWGDMNSLGMFMDFKRSQLLGEVLGISTA